MRTHRIRFCAFTMLLFGLAPLTCPAGPKSVPSLQIEEAIERAKAYIANQKIDVSHRYISSVKFEAGPKEGRGPFWSVTWELDSNITSEVKTAGGQVFVNVYLDHQIEVRYGE